MRHCSGCRDDHGHDLAGRLRGVSDDTVRRLIDQDGLPVTDCSPAEIPGDALARHAVVLLRNDHVHVTPPANNAQNVTTVRAKARSGEAGAGLVYVTGAKTIDPVQAITPAGAADVVNMYRIAVLKRAPNAAAAQAFVAFVTGAEGQGILASYGFQKP